MSLVYGNIDLEPFVERFRAVPVLANSPVGRRGVQVNVKSPHRQGLTNAMACREEGSRGSVRLSITLYDYAWVGPSEAVETLLHEFVHLSGCWGHDVRFKRRLLRAVEMAFKDTPIDLSVAERLADGATDRLDAALVRALAPVVTGGPFPRVQEQLVIAGRYARTIRGVA